MTPPLFALNPLEGLGTAAHAYDNVALLVLGWAVFSFITTAGVIAGKVVAARRRDRVACPIYGGTATVLHVRGADGVLDVAECTRRPGEDPVRCTKDCLHAAA